MILFKLPNDPTLYTIEPTENASFSVDFFDFHQRLKFHFSGQKKRATENDLQKMETLFHEKKFNLPLRPVNEDFDTYEKKINIIQFFLAEKKIPKLVFSRRIYHYFETEISIVDSFKKMGSSYPQALVYVFVSDKVCWMGGFSEILGKYNKKSQEFSTMSLAGTLPLEEDWTQKEIQEQKAVTTYISSVLKNYDPHYQMTPLKDAISGNIKHLYNEFHAHISPQKVEDLIQTLHPTPAVCGVPKEVCINKINELEDEERSLYSGYINLESADEKISFVNLRCAEIFSNGAKIYSGGGINEQSQPEKEWRETELKAEAVLKNLVFLR